MGITNKWEQHVIQSLENVCNPILLLNDAPLILIQCSSKLFINLVSLNTALEPQQLILLQEKYQHEGKLLVHLWEDVWLLNQSRVLSRIKSFLGINLTIHGRKTKIIPLDFKETRSFFKEYHLQGYIKAKSNYGLMYNNDLVAAASFSVRRPMKSKGVNYYSSELIRFASKDNVTVVGGLSKLLQHHFKQVNLNDIMTYADRDWSLGKGYEKLGFNLTTITDPAYLYVDENTKSRYFPHRLPKEILSAFDQQNELDLDAYLATHGFVKAFNTGNLKYHLYV